MSEFDLATGFLVLIAAAGWVNARWFRLPTASAMLFMGLTGGAVLLLFQSRTLKHDAFSSLVDAIRGLDFPKTVLGYLLAFLLFAGSTQVDLVELRRRFLAVGTLATLGVAACTAIVSIGLWLGARLLGLPLTLRWALVFGALISPTDPIAVLAAVRDGKLPKSLQAVLQGEALLNDGVGIVVFSAALAFALQGQSPDGGPILLRIAVQSLGGLAIGVLTGLVAIRGIRAIDDYPIEVTITLALAMASYSLAQVLGVSGPLAVVAAGLLVGDRGLGSAMSETSQTYVRGFWTLVDEILNALLFLLLGLELLIIPINLRLAGFWILAVALVVAARGVVVYPWGLHFNLTERRRGAALLLGWGGLHGALSLALALSIPPGPSRNLILSTTFAVVVFSILFQGATFAPMTRRVALVEEDAMRDVPAGQLG
jgi:CPA1 family monovalent cation:H+ antiporter